MNALPEVSIVQVYGPTGTVGCVTAGGADKRIGTLGYAGRYRSGGTFDGHGEQRELVASAHSRDCVVLQQ